MREPKYLNESGSKRGNWYLNRLDYFEFHQFDGMFKYKVLSVLAVLACIVLFDSAPLVIKPFLLYIIYVSVRSFEILHRQVCRWKGYALYPNRFVEQLKLYRKEHENNDFDSLATMEKSGAGIDINQHMANQAHFKNDLDK